MTTTVETTTKLYRLTSVIDDWPHRDARYNDVRVTWFVRKRDYDPGFDYVTLLDRPVPPGEGYSYEQGLVDESFTRREADQLAEYLREAHSTEVEIAEVSTPIATRADDGAIYIPTGAIAVGGDCDFYMLSEHDDYSLPFEAWGYYVIDFADDFEVLPTWSELRPNGRDIFYEGDEPKKFAQEILAEFGFDPSDDPAWRIQIDADEHGDAFVSYQFHCPPEHLDAIYGGDRWALGS